MYLDVPVRQGEIVRQRVPIGELPDGGAIALPVVTIGGARPGPTLYLQAGIHGAVVAADRSNGVLLVKTAKE